MCLVIVYLVIVYLVASLLLCVSCVRVAAVLHLVRCVNVCSVVVCGGCAGWPALSEGAATNVRLYFSWVFLEKKIKTVDWLISS